MFFANIIKMAFICVAIGLECVLLHSTHVVFGFLSVVYWLSILLVVVHIWLHKYIGKYTNSLIAFSSRLYCF